MPFQELNLEPWQYVILIPFLIAICFYLWQVEGCSESISEPYKAVDEEMEEIPTDNYLTRYGAYIQAQGRYYN